MNKINPIFEALSYVDERHVPAAQGKATPKKLKIALIALISAAALALLAGSTAAVRGRFTFGFSKENSASHSFELNITAQEFTVPEEFRPQNGEPHFPCKVDIPPHELFEKFGIAPPINDNFTDVNDERPFVEVGILDDNIKVEFRYVMYNKSIDNNVYFNSLYFSKTENMTCQFHQELLPGEPSEVVTLKDGSLCMVTRSSAVFSLNGAYCEIKIPYEYDVPLNIDQMTIDEQYQVVAEMIEAMPGTETVKQVLADLDLL